MEMHCETLSTSVSGVAAGCDRLAWLRGLRRADNCAVF